MGTFAAALWLWLLRAQVSLVSYGPSAAVPRLEEDLAVNERHSVRHTCVYKPFGEKAVPSLSGDTIRKIVDSRQPSCTHDWHPYPCTVRESPGTSNTWPFSSGLARGGIASTATE